MKENFMAHEKCPCYMKDGCCKNDKRKCNITEEHIQQWFDEKLAALDTPLDVCPLQSMFGNYYFVLSDSDIEKLQSGKVLYSDDKLAEYGFFIRYEGGKKDAHPIKENNQEN